MNILEELADDRGFFQCDLYDKAGSFQIPFEIMEAAQLLTKWAEANNMKNWRLNGIASRYQLEMLELSTKPQKYVGMVGCGGDSYE